MKQMLIKGRAGSGKTKGILFKEVQKIIDKDENILFVDTKQEYYDAYSKVLKEKGYNVITLNLKDPKSSHGYNPFTLPFNYYKNNNKDKAYELINSLAKSIFSDGNNNIDPYWENTASDLFTGLSILLFEKADEKTINLGSLNSSLKSLETTIPKYLETLDPNDPIYICTSGTAFAPVDTKGSIISVFRQKITAFCLRENLMNLLSKTDFDFSFQNQKTAIFILAREDSKTINIIANTLIQQIFDISLNQNVKFNFILDNIEMLPYMSFLGNMLAVYNDNVITYIATRDEDELKKQYNSKIFINIDKVVQANDKDIQELSKESLELPILQNKAEYFDLNKELEIK